MTSFTVHCPHCQTGFPVDPDKVPEGGVRARCTSCEGIFDVDVPSDLGAHAAGAGAAVAAAAAVVAAPPVEDAALAEEFDSHDAGDAEHGGEVDVEPEGEVDVEPEGEVDVEPDTEGLDEVEPVVAEEPDTSFVADPMESFDEPVFGDVASEEPVFDEAAAFEEPAEEEAAEEALAEPEPAMEAALEEAASEVTEETEPEVMEEAEAETEFDDSSGIFTIQPEERRFEPPTEEAGTQAVDAPELLSADPSESSLVDDDLILDDSAFGGGFDDVAEAAADVTESPAEPVTESPDDDWVLEKEERVQPSEVEVDRLDTVEEQVRGFQDETYEASPSEGIERVVPGSEEETFSGYTAPDPGPDAIEAEPGAEGVSAAEAGLGEAPTVEEVPSTGEAPAAPEPETETAARPAAFTFGKRDPHDKAKRLARVLVSDMITYNPDRHTRALENNSIREDFEEEISKSWQEYVDQVGAEIAESTDYWTQALNDVLAKGEKLF